MGDTEARAIRYPRYKWVRTLEKYRSTIIRTLPLGVLLPTAFFFGAIGPDDVARNYANWARTFGLRDWADWLAQYANGPRVFWAVVSVSLIYLAVSFGMPAIVKKARKSAAAVYVPICTTALIIGAVYAWYAVTLIGEWYISPTEESDLKAAIAAAPTPINSVLISVVPAAGTSAMSMGYNLMYIFSSAPGWHATLNVIDPEYSPKQMGLRISVKAHTDPEKNANAMLLKSIFEKAGFHPDLGGDNMMIDAAAAKIVVGKSP
ncbi:MAG: hypothetical protein WAV38_32265 [Xanthobacteraceae bacterium]